MFLTIHGPAAILISEHAPNIYWAFILSFISHFFLDFLPHENLALRKWLRGKNEIKKYFYLALADLSLLSIITAILFHKLVFSHPFIIIAGLFGAILPDILWGIYKVTKWKILKPYYQLHYWTHDLWEDHLKPSQVVLIQSGLLTLFLYLIIKL